MPRGNHREVLSYSPKLWNITNKFLYIIIMPFTQEYLKEYEEKIRQLPLEELYDILNLIRDDSFNADDSPERVKIVEKRNK